MEYALAFEDGPETVPGGTGILLLHPSTVETDRVDTAFLKRDTDHCLIVSTRTTAREVRQKLDHYEVPADAATILDTLSIERGYTRRQRPGVRYLSAPDDLEGMIAEVRRFLEETTGKRRISIDSITEMIYFAEEDGVATAVDSIHELLETHDAVGLFHMSDEVHEAPTVARFRRLLDARVDLEEDGSLEWSA